MDIRCSSHFFLAKNITKYNTKRHFLLSKNTECMDIRCSSQFFLAKNITKYNAKRHFLIYCSYFRKYEFFLKENIKFIQKQIHQIPKKPQAFHLLRVIANLIFENFSWLSCKIGFFGYSVFLLCTAVKCETRLRSIQLSHPDGRTGKERKSNSPQVIGC